MARRRGASGCGRRRHLTARHRILLPENMDLDGLIEDEVWTYLYTDSPVPIAGATGSIGAPVAVN